MSLLRVIWLRKHVLSPSQNKYSFKSSARELKRGKNAKSAYKIRRGRGGKRWRSTLILGQILNPKTTLILGWREHCSILDRPYCQQIAKQKKCPTRCPETSLQSILHRVNSPKATKILIPSLNAIEILDFPSMPSNLGFILSVSFRLLFHPWVLIEVRIDGFTPSPTC